MPPDAAAAIRTVGVQVVLFDNDPEQQVQLAGALAATVRNAREQAGVERVVVRYGDCSRWPCLSADDRARIVDAATGEGSGAADLTFTHFGANLGSGGGSNALAAAGDDDAIWVLNPDTYPAPTALATLLATLAVAGVAAAEARQIPIEHPRCYDPETGETSWASGACTLYRRAAFDGVGGFDAGFFPLYCDDVDLSWRLRLAGWSIRHVPRAVVFHDKPISDDGAVRWSVAEARSSHLARLWLYRRYGRPDLEQELRARARTGDDPVLASAVDEFEARVAAGDAPDPIDAAEAVATFVEGQLAPRRFAYAG